MRRATEEGYSAGKVQQDKSSGLPRHLMFSLNFTPLLGLAVDQALIVLVHPFNLEIFRDSREASSLHGNHAAHQGAITNSETIMNKEQPATKQRDFVRKESKGNSNVMSGRHGQAYIHFLKRVNEVKPARRHLSEGDASQKWKLHVVS